MTLSERLKKFDMYSKEEPETPPISPELISICSELSKALSKKIATIPIWFNYTKEEQKELIKNFLNAKLNEQFSEIKLTSSEKERVTAVFFNSIYGFGSLDFLISKKDVSKIFVNSPNEIFIDINGHIEKTDVNIDEEQFKTLIQKLINISAKSTPVITFRFNNLLVTILKEPVCSTKLILKKVLDTEFDFGYFERRDILNNDISDFFRMILNDKKKILISAPAQSGKTALLNAFINEIIDDSRATLFEEGALINSSKGNLTRFDVEGLAEKEQDDLITAALYYKPDFIFSDINDFGFNIEISEIDNNDTGFISTVRANSYIEAFSFYTSGLVSRLKCTEKLAKIRFAKDVDYIIQLQKDNEYFKISSIISITANKAGTPVLTEILTFKSGEYKYKFDKKITAEVPKTMETKIQEKPPMVELPKKLTFSARLKP